MYDRWEEPAEECERLLPHQIQARAALRHSYNRVGAVPAPLFVDVPSWTVSAVVAVVAVPACLLG